MSHYGRWVEGGRRRWASLYLVGASRSHASNLLLKECLHATLQGQRWILWRAVTKQIRLTSSLRPGRRCTDPCLLTCKFLGSGTCSSLVCSGQIIKLRPVIGLSWFRQHYSDTAVCTYQQYQAPAPLMLNRLFQEHFGRMFFPFWPWSQERCMRSFWPLSLCCNIYQDATEASRLSGWPWQGCVLQIAEDMSESRMLSKHYAGECDTITKYQTKYLEVRALVCLCTCKANTHQWSCQHKPSWSTSSILLLLQLLLLILKAISQHCCPVPSITPNSTKTRPLKRENNEKTLSFNWKQVEGALPVKHFCLEWFNISPACFFDNALIFSALSAGHPAFAYSVCLIRCGTFSSLSKASREVLYVPKESPRLLRLIFTLRGIFI